MWIENVDLRLHTTGVLKMYFNQNFTSKIIASVANKKDSTLRIKDLDNLDLVKFAYGKKGFRLQPVVTTALAAS